MSLTKLPTGEETEPKESTGVREFKELLREKKAFSDIEEMLQHEINNLTTVWEGSRDMAAKKRSEGDHSRADYYLQYAKEAEKIRNKIEEYMNDLSEQKDIPYKPEPTGLVRVIEDAVHICSGILEKKHVEIKQHNGLPPEDIYFMGDSLRMTMVMINILSNMSRALEHTRHAKIEVRMQTLPITRNRTGTYYVRTVVSNNGPRLPYDNPDKAFERYTSGEGSTGIGLATCREIVEKKFGGRMYAQNPEEGGAAFYIELPTCRRQK